MPSLPPDSKSISVERAAFQLYLRTGKRLAQPAERKFNPYHDPRNGRFTFAPGGPRSATAGTDPRAAPASQPKPAKPPGRRRDDDTVSGLETLLRSALPRATAQDASQLAGRSRGSRPSRGRGGPRPAGDPKLLDDVFPGLSRSRFGSVVELVDGALDLTTPANAATGAIHDARVRRLVAEIREVNPRADLTPLAEPQTLEERVRQIKDLRLRRALAYYRHRDDVRLLQVEVLRIMQERANLAYEEAVKRYDKGRLTPRLSREEAIGNYVDADVRAHLRRVFNGNRVDISRGQAVRVVGREYDTSGTDRTYRIPDARVGNVAFDVTLTRKTLATRQVRGFFDADFKPDAVLIIRPSQLGGSFTYAIRSPRQ